jgi:hypothetical protein
MPVSINNTQVVFNDATTQTTAPVNTNANVNSVAAGTGISVNTTTGAVTVTNGGVTSLTAGSGISVVYIDKVIYLFSREPPMPESIVKSRSWLRTKSISLHQPPGVRDLE